MRALQIQRMLMPALKIPRLNNASEKFRLRRKLEHFHLHPESQQDIGFNAMVSNWGMYSMSEDPSNILMWPHYADSHRGICLEFRTDAWPFNFNLWPVVYSNEYPLVGSVVNNVEDTMRSFLLTKAANWSYEKEWRVLMRRFNPIADEKIIAHEPDEMKRLWRLQFGPGHYKFSKDNLTAVIFGIRTTDVDKQKVLSWIHAGDMTPRLLQATLNRTRFQIDIINANFRTLRKLQNGSP